MRELRFVLAVGLLCSLVSHPLSPRKLPVFRSFPTASSPRCAIGVHTTLTWLPVCSSY